MIDKANFMLTYNKFRNKKVTIDGYTFSSLREAERYRQLKLLVKTRKITHLELQPKFTLQESFKDNEGNRYRPIVYIADFSYSDIDKDCVVVEACIRRPFGIYSIRRCVVLKLKDIAAPNCSVIIARDINRASI